MNSKKWVFQISRLGVLVLLLNYLLVLTDSYFLESLAFQELFQVLKDKELEIIKLIAIVSYLAIGYCQSLLLLGESVEGFWYLIECQSNSTRTGMLKQQMIVFRYVLQEHLLITCSLLVIVWQWPSQAHIKEDFLLRALQLLYCLSLLFASLQLFVKTSRSLLVSFLISVTAILILLSRLGNWWQVCFLVSLYYVCSLIGKDYLKGGLDVRNN